MQKFEKHIPITAENTNVISVLSQYCELSRNQIKLAIDKGALWLTVGKSTQRFRRLKKPLKPQSTLHFYYDENILNQIPAAAQLIADHKEYSVWYKPYGMLSQGSKWSDHCTITRWAQKHFLSQRPVFIVHRLDRAATGLILVAHSKKAVKALSAMFEVHDLNKEYYILAHGDFSAYAKNETQKISTDIDNKSALSYFSHLNYDAELNVSLINVKIATGRKHQIRLHAASIGFPVVGDRLHGNIELNDALESSLFSISKNINTLNLQLCAQHLTFTCPLSEENRSYSLPETLKPSFVALKS